MNSQRGQAVLISLQAQRNARLAFLRGALAQLGERLICIQEVIGSIPIGSTKALAAIRSSTAGTDAGKRGRRLQADRRHGFAGSGLSRFAQCLVCWGLLTGGF